MKMKFYIMKILKVMDFKKQVVSGLIWKLKYLYLGFYTLLCFVLCLWWLVCDSKLEYLWFFDCWLNKASNEDVTVGSFHYENQPIDQLIEKIIGRLIIK